MTKAWLSARQLSLWVLRLQMTSDTFAYRSHDPLRKKTACFQGFFFFNFTFKIIDVRKLIRIAYCMMIFLFWGFKTNIWEYLQFTKLCPAHQSSNTTIMQSKGVRNLRSLLCYKMQKNPAFPIFFPNEV